MFLYASAMRKPTYQDNTLAQAKRGSQLPPLRIGARYEGGGIGDGDGSRARDWCPPCWTI